MVQKICQFEKSSNLIGRELLTPKSQEYDFSQVCEWCPVISHYMTFISACFQQKQMTQF